MIALGGGHLRGMIAQEGLTVDGFIVEGKDRIEKDRN